MAHRLSPWRDKNKDRNRLLLPLSDSSASEQRGWGVSRWATRAALPAGLLLACWLLAPGLSRATVYQVDGLVVPVSTGSPCPGTLDQCTQTALTFGEGFNPPTSLLAQLDAVIDANTGPEIFRIPRENDAYLTVTFRLLQEGASFENIFGWYNVGEPNLRFPVILSCPNGNIEPYEPPAYNTASPPLLVGGFVAQVNFQAEYEAGRFLGGPVAFYLITPEDSPAGNDCATDPYDQGVLIPDGQGGFTPSGPIDDDGFDENDGQDDDNGFGRLYYTESKLNNDGNYVHYLIYRSKVDHRHFYFAFEDFFRGGDNDFDDIIVKVEGLEPLCEPEQEICNGEDDNCNGAIDENLFRDCSNACGPGQERCSFSNDGNPNNDWIDCDAPQVSPEICNGIDDDCNGIIDDNLGELPACTLGGCTGKMRCVAGKLLCDADKQSTEICDGKDNDCDGEIDENLVRLCFSACGVGSETCQFSDDGDPDNDWVGCSAPQPSAEICDGLDNDCNGVVDDNVAGEGVLCDNPSGDTCEQGRTKCVHGQLVCVGATAGSLEVCDCKDNDCDGLVDEDNPCPAGMDCIDCACRIRCSGEEFGCPSGYTCVNDYCVYDECTGVNCPEGEYCVSGFCVTPCEEARCAPGYFCKNGFCFEDNCYGRGCPEGQICYDLHCIDDPCAEVSCGLHQYCKEGTCRTSCGPAVCGEHGRCVDGECVANLCAAMSCGPEVPCLDGSCDTACKRVHCGKGRICRFGECVSDPCAVVRCYSPYELCMNGQCVSATTYSGARTEILASGGGGLACTAQGPVSRSPPTLLILLLLLAVIAAVKRGVP